MLLTQGVDSGDPVALSRNGLGTDHLQVGSVLRFHGYLRGGW